MLLYLLRQEDAQVVPTPRLRALRWLGSAALEGRPCTRPFEQPRRGTTLARRNPRCAGDEELKAVSGNDGGPELHARKVTTGADRGPDLVSPAMAQAHA